MGCCFSSEEDKDTLTTEPDETTRLINPASNHSPRSICCCCRHSDNDHDDEYRPDIQPIIPDSRPSQTISQNLMSSSDFRDGGPSSGPVKTSHHGRDEQSAFDGILQKTARNVIDVSVESNLVEQTEYQERARQYSNRINMVVSGSSWLKHKPNLSNHVTAPQAVLASKPISINDIQLITSATEKAAKCVKDIKVQHKENLVVPFGVP